EFQLRLKFSDHGLLRLANAPFGCLSRPSYYHCFKAQPSWRSTCRRRRIGSRQTSIIDSQSFPSAFPKSPCPGPDNRWILFALDQESVRKSVRKLLTIGAVTTVVPENSTGVEMMEVSGVGFSRHVPDVAFLRSFRLHLKVGRSPSGDRPTLEIGAKS